MSYNESLSPNSNYPPMSQSEWDDAPWNDPVIPEKDFEVTVSQTLSKTVTVTTNNYVPEYDEDGSTYANTEDTNWGEEFHNNDYHTPQQLLALFKEVLEKNLEKGIVFKSPKFTQDLIKECEDWIEDDCEFMKE